MKAQPEVLEISGHEVTITNPTKIFFAESGVTKLDLVRYYLAVADGALRGVRGRPMALKRFVNGAAGEAFFQKRAPDNRPDWLRVATLSFPSGRTADEIVVDDAAGLAWIVNLGCLDLNPHPVRVRRPRSPRRTPGRPRSSARRRVGPDSRCRHGREGIARGGRARGLAQDLRLARHPHQRPDRAPLDLPGRPAGGAGAGPGRRTPRTVHRHLQVVEGGTPRRLPRLQPERQGSDRGLGLFRPAAARCARLDTLDLGGAAIGAGGGVHGPHRSRALRGDRRPGRGIDDAVGSLHALLELSRRDEAEGLGDAPWPPNYRKQEGEPPRVQPSRQRRATADYDTPEAEAEREKSRAAMERRFAAELEKRAEAKAAGVGTTPTPTGRRRSTRPGDRDFTGEVERRGARGTGTLEGRWPDAAAALEPADVLVDGMRGRSSLWYRVRVNLTHVPDGERPPQEATRPRLRPVGRIRMAGPGRARPSGRLAAADRPRSRPPNEPRRRPAGIGCHPGMRRPHVPRDVGSILRVGGRVVRPTCRPC